ncbi:MAG TPA: GTP 3',8-cyclase MoaA [bacterium]|nr:GTP 3',8-cyclase MoaA [bacterium]
MSDGKEARGGALRDNYDRNITYLRVSVTDRCNMRCVYCIPEGAEFIPHEEILTYDEIERIVKIGAGAGIRKVRLTGGEPLARKNVERLVAQLSRIDSLEDLSLTTNGLLLAEKAEALAAAGLKRVNVSLDTLDPAKFSEICRRGDIGAVIGGIRSAGAAGLRPVKVNVVVMRGRNEHEAADFIRFALDEGVVVRFIEYMPFNRDEEWRARYVSRDETIASLGSLIDASDGGRTDPSAPARYFKIKGSDASVGFISPISHGFCNMCNRMRLTPGGQLLACLLSPSGVDLKSIIRAGGSDDEIRDAFRLAAESKGPRGNFPDASRPMHTVGG